MTDDVLTPEQVEAVRDAILYGHDPRQPTVAEYVALADSHEALRRANAALNRRAQSAESGLAAALKGHERDGPSLGRALANAAATMYREQAEGLRAALADSRGREREAIELLTVEVIDEDGNEMIECVVCRKRHGDHEPGCKAEALAARQQGETNPPKEST